MRGVVLGLGLDIWSDRMGRAVGRGKCFFRVEKFV